MHLLESMLVETYLKTKKEDRDHKYKFEHCEE